MNRPFVSVIVLNYNSLRFLDACLGSLGRQDYPRDRYEVVLVDNLSHDGSADEAERRFPEVRVVHNGRNLGFAAGNNVAMRSARADYVVLLNNDTSVDERWLSKLVDAAEEDPRAGACTSKLIFLHDRVPVQLETDSFRPGDHGAADPRELGVQLFEARVVQDGEQEAEYIEGFFGQEPSPDGLFRWTGPRATMGLRVDRGSGPARLRLRVGANRPNGDRVKIAIRDGETILAQLEIGSSPEIVEIDLPPSVVAKATPVIQNAGTKILLDGSGRDRGTIVEGTSVFQEDDRGQYDLREEVFAGCGASLLFRRTMLEDVGLFDEDFFMYYEDMDLSWRARRRGWKILYVPDSVVRHVHCGSSGEWSPLFIFHVERNRLLMLAKNAPAGLVMREHARYLAETAMNGGRFLRAFVLRSGDLAAVSSRLRIQLQVLGSLAGMLGRTLAKRRQLKATEKVPAAKIMEWRVSA